MLGYITNTTGLFKFAGHFGSPKDRIWAILNIGLFLLLTLSAELIFRIWRRAQKRELACKPSLKEFTVDEVKKAVHEGKKQWWVMDNCVLSNDMMFGKVWYD